ncbi:uncharacterized protein LOC114531790 [Dendronephthya gigantea]|uniref:uncharacterized protein LOC114531790 n=1 Tax=Dendronephthya gigantea TaxID=151771 RepID=UPI001068E707|nr:uncharacterized protein LOC114531790 [Dendronephthya gigantea]
MAEKQSDFKSTKECSQDAVESSDVPFLYNGQFFILAVLCSLPLLYFGGERLFGVGALCLVTVYVFHISFHETKSSVIGFVICVAIMQFAILYSIGPLIWQSVFNVIFLLVYNVFIVLTGGLGLLQFEVFRRDEVDFCENVEYFLFLLYPPCCVLILMWLISLAFGVHLAPYSIIAIGFPMCHTFLDPKLRPSFSTKSDQVLGHPEKMLALFNFVFSPSFVYCLVNFFNLLHHASLISALFCISVPLFLITFLDTTDLRDMADIRNSQWQIFQVVTGCFSLILGAILAYLHEVVDGTNAVFLAVILACSTTLFFIVKYRYSKIMSSFTCGFLLITYLAWFTTLPWNLDFSIGNEIKLSFFTVDLLVSLLGVISVVAVAVSLSVRYRSNLNHILLLHTFGFVVLEIVLVDSEAYSPYLMILTSLLVLYLVQRLYNVRRLTKASAVMCFSLHGTKLLLILTSWNTKLEATTSLLVVFSGFGACATLTNIFIFEHNKHLDRNEILGYTGILFGSLVLLSSTSIQSLCVVLNHSDSSSADIIGIILILTGACFAKLAFLNSEEQAMKKQSILVIFTGVLFTILQPHASIEVFTQLPKLIFREVFYDTWAVIFAEYIILPWCLFVSLSFVMLLLLKLLSLKAMTAIFVIIMSVCIGAPLGLYVAHWVLPYPKLPSSFLSIPYIISAAIVTSAVLLASKGQSTLDTGVKIYVVFLIVSIASVVGEVYWKIRINFLQSEIPPSVIYQVFLHLIMIILSRPQSELQTSLEKKDPIFSNATRNISVLLVFICGLAFSPKYYYDIMLVPVCGLVLMLRTKNVGVLKIGKNESTLKKVLFAGIICCILYYRLIQQLPLDKAGFWSTVAFVLEVSVAIGSFLVFLVIFSTFWHQSISRSEELFLAVLCPVFTLMLFYGRTTAGQVLGIVGPALAYNAFYYPSR